MLFKAHKYQNRAMWFMFQHRYNALFLDMGLGKTIITLTFLRKMLLDGKLHKILIIAPKKVAESTWDQEAQKWDHTKPLKISKILGSEKKRLEALKTPSELYIINVDNLHWLYNNMPVKSFFDYIVVDELSMFKNKDSKRFKAIMQLRPFVKGITGLTGTPSPNSLLDLWAPICILDLGKRFNSFYLYRKKYFTYISFQKGTPKVKDSRRGKYLIKHNVREEIYNKLKDLCLTMKAKDYIEIPKVSYNYIDVLLPKKAYDAIETFATEIKYKNITVKDMVAVTNKLLMFANGRVYDKDKNIVVIHNEKLNKLKEIYDTSFGQNIFIMSCYKCDTYAILDTFPEACELTTSEDIAYWNSGQCRMMVANPKSCGHGLNLQAGGNIIIWYSLTWSLEQYLQANARIHRQGQTKPVIIHHLVSSQTIDDTVLDVLSGKYSSQEALLHALKISSK